MSSVTLRLCAWLLLVGALAVPRSRRGRWRAEWWAELVFSHRSALPPDGGPAAGRELRLVARASGCLLDGLALGLEAVQAWGRRRRLGARRLARTPLRGAAAVASLALPLVLAGASLSTLPALLRGDYDEGLAAGAAALVVVSLLLFFAATAGLRRAFRASRDARQSVLLSMLLVALLAGPLAARLLASAITYVGQDELRPPGAVAVLVILGALAAAGAPVARGLARWAGRCAAAAPRVALAVALLAGVASISWSASWREGFEAELGFEPAGLHTLRVELPAASPVGLEELLRAVREQPGVMAASATSLAPLSRAGNEVRRLSGPVRDQPTVTRGIGSGYFKVLQSTGPAPATPRGGLVNAALARLSDAGPGMQDEVWRVDGRATPIVGIAPDIQHFDPGDPLAPVLYYPLGEGVRSFDLLVRVAPGTQAVLIAVADQVRSRAAGAAMSPATPVEELLRARLAYRGLIGGLLALLATSSLGVALLLWLGRPATPAAIEQGT